MTEIRSIQVKTFDFMTENLKKYAGNIITFIANPLSAVFTLLKKIKDGFGGENLGVKPFKFEFPKSKGALDSFGSVADAIKQQEIDRQNALKGKIGGAGGSGGDYETTVKDYMEMKVLADNVTKANQKWEEVLAKIQERVTAIHDFYKSIKLVSADFIGQQTAGFDKLAEKAKKHFDVMSLGISALNKSKPKETSQSDAILAEFERAEDFRKNMKNTLLQGKIDMVSGVAEWVGAFATGIKSFKDLGGLMSGILGDLMMNIGKQMLTFAITKSSFEAAIKKIGGGAAGIPIALALIAAGSALKASSSKSSGSSYQQVPINSVSNYQPVYTPYNSQSNSGAGGRVSVQITQAPNVLRGGDIRTSQQTVDYGISRGFGTQQGF